MCVRVCVWGGGSAESEADGGTEQVVAQGRCQLDTYAESPDLVTRDSSGFAPFIQTGVAGVTSVFYLLICSLQHE